MQLPTYKKPPQLSKSTSVSTKFILTTIVNHLAYRDAPIDAKEVAESVEFYLRTAKRLLGAAKTTSQKKQQQKQRQRQKSNGGNKYDNGQDKENSCSIVVHDLVKLVDRYEPPSHLEVKECISEVCPWIIANKENGDGDGDHADDDDAVVVQFVPATLEEYFEMQQEDGDSKISSETNIVISTHACGSLTDDVLRFAAETATATEISAAASIAVMPCCYTGTDKGTPYSIRRALGVSMAADIKRSYFLQNLGYHVDFCTIPREITPMNRIIVAEKRN
ncbi:MAG: hypothetical protein SGARI_000875 [Bacillariaceae sp.]